VSTILCNDPAYCHLSTPSCSFRVGVRTSSSTLAVYPYIPTTWHTTGLAELQSRKPSYMQGWQSLESGHVMRKRSPVSWYKLPPPMLNHVADAQQVASALLLILLTSFSSVRGIVFELFLRTHTLLALTVIGSTIWHILPGDHINLLFPIISISIWSINTLLVGFYHSRGYITSYKIFSQSDPRLDAVKFTVRVPHRFDAKPGYLYLYFSGLRWRYRFQSHPFIAIWCEYGVENDSGIDNTDLTFLVQPRGGLTARLVRELPFQSLVSFNGPYSQNLHLEDYETVMLVAEGMGIAAVLPHAQHLVRRSYYDAQIKKLLKLTSTSNKDDLRKSRNRDVTRSVNLFWKLELNDQEKWVSDELRTLQDLDPGRVSSLRTF
jgi:hypothetical protein